MESPPFDPPSGPDRSYLWILSRTPTMAPETWKMLTDKARSLGFDVDALVMGQDAAQAE